MPSPSRVLALLVLWLALSGVARAADPLVLDSSRQSVDLGSHLGYYHDPGGHEDAARMLATARSGGFAPLPGGRATFGFARGAYWFHARLFNDNTTEQRWLLVLAYPLLDNVDVHLRYPDGQWRHMASGDALPFSSRSVGYRHPNFWLDLPQRTEIDLLVRVASESSVQVPLSLYTASAFAEMERESQLGIGVYDGILLSLFLYNLILWLAVRDSGHLWYTFHVGAFGLVLFCLNGLAFEYLWPDLPRLANHAIPISMGLALIAMQQFTRVFLELPQRWPLADRCSLGLIALCAALALLSPVLEYRSTVIPLTLMVLPNTLLILLATLRAMRDGYAPARLFLYAWSALLAGTALYASLSFGLVAKNLLTEYGIQIGSALEMVLLSFALAYRYANLRNENEQIVREAKDKLERNVARRTAELSSALEQLAEANARLRESNRRDALTGAFNRRHFREMFEQLLRQCSEQRRGLGVMLIDLDHFKQVNDTYGHLAGDECLRHFSRCLHDHLASSNAVIARYGGEEFAVLIPDANPVEVLALAEGLRKRFADAPVTHGGDVIRMSASVGLYNIAPGASVRADDALHRADEALYAAKGRGRNCVQVTTELP